MALADLLSKLRRREQKQAASAAERYAQLIDQAADDQQINEESAAKILAAAGKSAADLAADVAHHQRQRQLRALVAELPEAEAARQTLQQDRAALEAEWDTFRDAWQARLKALDAELRAADKRLDKIGQAKTKLLNANPPTPREAQIRGEINILNNGTAVHNRLLLGNPRNGDAADRAAAAQEQDRIKNLKAELESLEAARAT